MCCHFYPSLGWLINRSSAPSGFGGMEKGRQWLLKEEVLGFWGSSLDLPSSKPGSLMTCNFLPPTSAEMSQQHEFRARCPVGFYCPMGSSPAGWWPTASIVEQSTERGSQHPTVLGFFSTSVPLWLWSLVGGCFRASLTIYRFNSIHLSHLQY